ncbi:hypothetical protein AB1484_16995 [Parafrankia sp. FMc6]|uniref:hypothetical protein n=1 Tax=Parafrankia soli TaxID=2599596 RepID=UPI0034D4CBF5
MLTPFDDYPVHQTALPVAHAGGGHPDHYDRFWFNGYDEQMYFALAFGLYPSRGIIDAAFSVVHDGVQRSVFASGRIPLDRTRTSIGPISVEIVEPLRVNRILVDAAEHGLVADLTATARTPAHEEPRVTQYDGTELRTDSTRATQMVTWTGQLASGGQDIRVNDGTYGTKDRSWGIRGVGERTPAAPRTALPQVFFLWAPLNFADECLRYVVMENEAGQPWLERSAGASLLLAPGETVELEPLQTFRMKGVGYLHPTWGHGRWHDELAVGGETFKAAELDTIAPDCVHVQQVVRAVWGDRIGLGVLEQLVIGPYEPGGFRGMLDGAPE